MKSIRNLALLVALGAMMFSCKSAPKEEKIPVGVQLYSVRGDMEKDFYGNPLVPLKQLASRAASPEEVAANSRARSARLRVGERVESGKLKVES